MINFYMIDLILQHKRVIDEEMINAIITIKVKTK